MLLYQDLISVPVRENGEAMQDIASFNLHVAIEHSLIPASTGKKLFLRTSACEKLVKARTILKEKHPEHELYHVYAYRSLAIQRSSYIEAAEELGLSGRDDLQAREEIHKYIAVPEVSGHPTGGALDLMIADPQGVPLDYGTKIHEMSEDSQYHSENISDGAKKNRQQLRNLMMQVGFAPYDGEWWHFSYGDREWAKYYDEPNAHYEQTESL